ncbi:MAG TPA: VanZ family protein [Steroidobacteraceae bacterium]|nr:VanZ family protein [Steroidobacteraceae bacterium]
MIASDRRIARWLLAAIVFLIAFGSLYPFSFSLAGAGPLERLGELPQAGTTRSDVAANILLYLPLGTCLAWLIYARRGATVAVLGATMLAAAFSFSIEFAQLYETRRVASLADLASNATGAFLGALLALAIARTRIRLHASPFAGLLRYPVAAALLFSWIGYRLAPFAPAFDTEVWVASVELLLANGWPAPGAALVHLLAWLVVLFLAERLAPARALALTAVAMVIVLAGRILFAGLGLEAAEVAGMAGALLLARPISRLARPRAAWVLASALLALIAWQGLAPFDFQLAQDRFALLPFGESLTQYRAANLADMFLRCFTSGAVVWLLFQTGLAAVVATGFGAGAIFAVEFLQTWLPGQTAEITDPLLALCTGGLIAVFERDSRA